MNDQVCLTNKDVLDFCNRQKGLEDNINEICKSIARIEANQKDVLHDLENRVRDLERFKAMVIAIALVFTTIMGIIGKSVWDMYIGYPQRIQDAVKTEITSYQNLH